MVKTALDSEAATYWEQYYIDSGYGKAWTKEIPMRIQASFAGRSASLAGASGKTAAATPVPTSIRPLSTVITDAGVHLEGIAVFETGKTRTAQAFVVDFDHDGQVKAFDAVKVR